MIVVKLMDGLGNQMFQYAFARYLQSIYNEKIIFETSKLTCSSVRKLGIQQLNICNDSIKFASPLGNYILKAYSKFMRIMATQLFGIKMINDSDYKKMIRIGFYTTECPIKYFEYVETKMPIKFVRGYFQSEHYFESIKNIIKNELKIKDIPQVDNYLVLEKMKHCESVSVHIRRGDYINNKKFSVCKENYYIRAIKEIEERIKNPTYFVFSNSIEDLKWIEENYNFPVKNIVYVSTGKNEFDDLRFMYNCKHHIIANSTFSWWGSYLSEFDNGVTIAPSKWFNDYEDYEDYEDIYRKDWIRIDPE